MFSKFKTLNWYLRQPNGLTIVRDLFLQKTVYKKNENSRQDSIKWCESVAINTSEALYKLFNIQGNNIIDPSIEYREYFKQAERLVSDCPVKLGGAGNLTLLYNTSEKIQANRVLETGVAYGWSSLAVLLSISKRNNSQLVSTDMPYAKMNSEEFVGLVVPDKFRSCWTLIREADKSAIPKALKLSIKFDMIHYDSDKSFLGRKRSYPVLFKALRNGGFFISDDVQDNLAFKIFCEDLNIQPIIISFENKYIGVVIKQ